jgi:hypothetical protein
MQKSAARALAQKVVIIDGLFSNLSNRELIKESLKAMALAAIDDAEQAVQAAEQLYSSAATQSGQVSVLRELSQFQRDGAPGFMKTAPSVAAKLRGIREHARQRTRFDFDLAQQRVNMADGEEARLDAEVRAKSDEKRNLRGEIAHLNTRREHARKAVDH